MSNIKVVFIVLDFGLAIRNILKNEFYSMLKSQKDVRLIVFSPITDKEFIKEYGGENVIIKQNPKHWNAFTKILHSLGNSIWEEKTEIFSFKDKRAGKRHRFRSFIIKMFAFICDYSQMLSLLNRLNLFLFHDHKASYYFEKYKPDIVFYTTMYAKGPCLELEAQKRGIKTACLIHSWDNPSTKGPFRMLPDKLIVWNRILKEEVLKYHNYPGKDIYVSGIPQFDIYYDKSKFVSKEVYFNRHGLDINKKLLTYATSTRGLVPFSHDIVEILYSAMKGNSFTQPCQLLIRLHPRDDLERYDKFKGLQDVLIQSPGRQANIPDKWHPTEDDMLKLAETMHYSDVLINIASTIAIDAIALDTPVIGVAFDGNGSKSYELSCKRYYDYNHYKNIVALKGLKIAYSKKEFIRQINNYLLDPSLDAEGRKRIRQEQCWKLDGKAGERIAKHLLAYLRNDH